MVLLELAVSAAVPEVVLLLEIIPATVVVLALPVRMQFLMVLCPAPSEALALPIHTIAPAVVASLLLIVRFLVVVLLFEPLMVT